MKKGVIGAIIAVMIVVGILIYIQSNKYIVVINHHPIIVEIENTDETREKGLGDRDSLAVDHGMLFVFDYDSKYAFWMKDMRFSIDMVWISSDGHIVDERENVSPDTYPTTFAPQTPARYVLELPAHTVKALNAKIGDIVRL